MNIKVTFERATSKYCESVRIECPGVNLSITCALADSLSKAIQVALKRNNRNK